MFWVKYIVTMLIGTALVYVAAPRLQDRLLANDDDEILFKRPVEEQVSRPVPLATAEPMKRKTVTSSVTPSKAAERASSRQSTPKASSGGEWHAPGSELADEPNPVLPIVSPSNEAAVPPIAEEPPQEVVVEQGPARSIDKIPVSAAGVIRWGVVVKDAAAYKPDGKRIQNKAPGGTLIEVTDAVLSKKGAELASCWCWSGRKWDGPILIATTDLLMFEGGRGNILAEDVDNLLEYHRFNAVRIARKEALEKAAVDANPHAVRLREMSAAYNEKADRVKVLTEQRDLAKGAKRTKISDELRKLEVVNAKEQAALKRQVDLYNKWKENHPIAVNLDGDREYSAAKRKMLEIFPKIEDFGVEEP